MTASSPGPGMRAVVTGGAGFLGSHLCERLLARGLHVVCLDNLITGSAVNLSHLTASPSFTLINCDITGFFSIDDEVDYIFHLASPASPADYLRFPVQTLKAGSIGTINALEVARDKKARFVLASSSEVYGDPLEHPQPNRTGGTSTRLARAAPMTRRNDSPKRSPPPTPRPIASASRSPGSSTATGRACGPATAAPSRPSSARPWPANRSPSPATGSRHARSATSTTPSTASSPSPAATTPARSTSAAT